MKLPRTLLTISLTLIAGTVCAGQEWVELTEQLKAHGVRGGRSGIEVDRATGDLYLGGRGVYRSRDRRKTWQRLDDGTVVGAQWFCFALDMDPEAPRMAIFKKDPPEDPVQSAISLDAGETWQPITRLKNDRRLHSYGWSWGQVNWTVPDPKTILARMHHSERMWLSRDRGRTWEELPLHTRYMGLYDADTLVACHKRKGRMLRSTDGGQTWEAIAEDLEVTAPLPVRFKDTIYWVVRDGLAFSRDGGKTWQRCPGRLEDAYWGPYFGETEWDIIVVTLTGVYLSRDGGAGWLRISRNKAVEDSEDYGKPKFRLDWFIGLADWAWDPVEDNLYLSHRGLYSLDLAAAERAAKSQEEREE